MSKRPDNYEKLETYRDSEVVRTYDERWAGARGARRDARKARAIEQAWSLLEARGGAALRTVLDLPAGTGRFTALLSSKASTYVGADLSHPMLMSAREKVPGSSLIVADCAELPLSTNSVDVSVCIRFLHLVRDRELRLCFLRELARVARHGVIVDYRHGRTVRVMGRHLRHKLGLRDKAPSNPSPAAIGLELRDAGLEELARVDVHRAPLLSDKLLVVARARAHS